MISLELYSLWIIFFQLKKKEDLQAIEYILEVECKLCLASNVHHMYGANFWLVNLTSNAAIIAYIHCFAKIALYTSNLKSINMTKSTIILFDAMTACISIEEVIMDISMGATYKKEDSKSIVALGTLMRSMVKKVNCIDVL